MNENDAVTFTIAMFNSECFPWREEDVSNSIGTEGGFTSQEKNKFSKTFVAVMSILKKFAKLEFLLSPNILTNYLPLCPTLTLYYEDFQKYFYDLLFLIRTLWTSQTQCP